MGTTIKELRNIFLTSKRRKQGPRPQHLASMIYRIAITIVTRLVALLLQLHTFEEKFTRSKHSCTQCPSSTPLEIDVECTLKTTGE